MFWLNVSQPEISDQCMFTLNNASDYQANGLLSDPTIGLAGYWANGLTD